MCLGGGWENLSAQRKASSVQNKSGGFVVTPIVERYLIGTAPCRAYSQGPGVVFWTSSDSSEPQASLTSAASASLATTFKPFLFLSLQAGSCDSAHDLCRGCKMSHLKTTVGVLTDSCGVQKRAVSGIAVYQNF